MPAPVPQRALLSAPSSFSLKERPGPAGSFAFALEFYPQLKAVHARRADEHRVLSGHRTEREAADEIFFLRQIVDIGSGIDPAAQHIVPFDPRVDQLVTVDLGVGHDRVVEVAVKEARLPVILSTEGNFALITLKFVGHAEKGGPRKFGRIGIGAEDEVRPGDRRASIGESRVRVGQGGTDLQPRRQVDVSIGLEPADPCGVHVARQRRDIEIRRALHALDVLIIHRDVQATPHRTEESGEFQARFEIIGCFGPEGCRVGETSARRAVEAASAPAAAMVEIEQKVVGHFPVEACEPAGFGIAAAAHARIHHRKQAIRRLQDVDILPGITDAAGGVQAVGQRISHLPVKRFRLIGDGEIIGSDVRAAQIGRDAQRNAVADLILRDEPAENIGEFSSLAGQLQFVGNLFGAERVATVIRTRAAADQQELIRAAIDIRSLGLDDAVIAEDVLDLDGIAKLIRCRVGHHRLRAAPIVVGVAVKVVKSDISLLIEEVVEAGEARNNASTRPADAIDITEIGYEWLRRIGDGIEIGGGRAVHPVRIGDLCRAGLATKLTQLHNGDVLKP